MSGAINILNVGRLGIQHTKTRVHLVFDSMVEGPQYTAAELCKKMAKKQSLYCFDCEKSITQATIKKTTQALNISRTSSAVWSLLQFPNGSATCRIYIKKPNSHSNKLTSRFSTK